MRRPVYLLFLSLVIASLCAPIGCASDADTACIADGQPSPQNEWCCSRKLVNSLCCQGWDCLKLVNLPDLTIGSYFFDYHIVGDVLTRKSLLVDINYDSNGENPALGHVVELRNIGSLVAKPISLSFSLVRSTSVGEDEHFCDRRLELDESLLPGRSLKLQQPFFCAINITRLDKGTYYLRIYIDPDQDIDELNEKNNIINTNKTYTVS